MKTRKYFGTDGIRGRVGVSPITPDFALRLGFAAGGVLARHRQEGERPTVLIGKDTRISGYMIEAALESGFSAAGVDVMLCGPLPTPAIAYLTRALRLSAGVVISASHNPYHDNGIKFFSAGGQKLPDAVEQEIEERLAAAIACVDSADLGKARRLNDAEGRYIEFCKSTFPTELDLRGLKLVVDCAHGAAYRVAPAVFHELGAEVVSIGIEPDGLNINHQVGATAPAALAAAVKIERAHFGIALDGDADRLIMVDSDGRVFDGDELLYVIVRQRHSISPVLGIVGTLMSNLGLEHALQRLKIPLVRAQVGDRYVLEALLQQGWQLGGENSGHILCLDKHTTGDGIVSALQVLAALKNDQHGHAWVTLTAATRDLTMYPQTLINVRLTPGFDWRTSTPVRAAVAAAESALQGNGRVLLRASGTEPLLRVMVEGQDGAQVAAQAQAIAEAARGAMATGSAT